VVGNTSIDAIRLSTKLIDIKQNEFARKYILITSHRRESQDSQLDLLLDTLIKLSKLYPDIEFRFVLHLNPKIYFKVKNKLKNLANVITVEPQTYLEFIKLVANAFFIITDSGGIQEEGPFLGKKVLVYRKVTERVEGVITGHCELLPVAEEKMIKRISDLLNLENISLPSLQDYGDGYASGKIIKILNNFLCEDSHLCK
jgi:UDP-N-acetylglucosamine 2-epimerase